MKINLTVNAPALEKMIQEVYDAGLAATYSEAVNVLLRELYDCRRQVAAWSADNQLSSPRQTPDPPSAPQETHDDTERLSW